MGDGLKVANMAAKLSRVEAQLSASRAECERLRGLLKEAVRCIEFFHGPIGWAEYQHSPEMKRFTQALAGGSDER